MSRRWATCSAPTSERGVFRSKDGGKTWEKILYRSDVAGAVDLSMDRNNPRILFAAFWEARRNFWNISSGGPGSGLFRSDGRRRHLGGDLRASPACPTACWARSASPVSPVRAGRVWALVEAEGDKTGLYRSDDYGARWTHGLAPTAT